MDNTEDKEDSEIGRSGRSSPQTTDEDTSSSRQLAESLPEEDCHLGDETYQIFMSEDEGEDCRWNLIGTIINSQRRRRNPPSEQELASTGVPGAIEQGVHRNPLLEYYVGMIRLFIARS